MRLVVALLLVPLAAHAERYVVQPGETLEHVADVFGCSTDDVLRANHLTNTLVPARTVITVPTCTKQTRIHTRSNPAGRASVPTDGDDRAQQALAVIDGRPPPAPSPPPPPPADAKLKNGVALPTGDGYFVRRPDRSFGTPATVAHVRAAIGEVRALYPEVHVLAVGDLSAKTGGKIGDHLSHQTGVDIDLGFYFKTKPAEYPAQFVDANANLDLAATWALLVALARSIDRDDGVTMMFLDYDVQARFVKWAAANGTPKSDLETLFQYPRGKDAMVGVIRHWPNHTNHVHVRFKTP